MMKIPAEAQNRWTNIQTDRPPPKTSKQNKEEFKSKSSSLLTKAIENQNIWHANWVKTLSFYPLVLNRLADADT